MRKKGCFFVIVALVMFSSNAFADLVVGTAAGGWQTWTTAVLNENVVPYWDGNSSDSSSPYNIGNYLTNTGGFVGGSGPNAAYDYWGIAGGGSDPFSFTWSGPSQGAMKLEVAGYATSNTLGYHDSSGDHVIFGGGATAGATAVFTPTSDYFLYLTSPDGKFRTDMGSADDLYQHFAIFKETDGVYWIGMEDLKVNSDYDYNDMVVKVAPVPIPGAIWLLGSGLIGLVGIRRRFKA